MFKFNFIRDDEEAKENVHLEGTNKKLKAAHECESSEEIRPVLKQEYGILSLDELKIARGEEDRSITFKKLSLVPGNDQILIEYVDSYAVEIDENDELAEINQTHDLVPGKYEGGLKVWELSIDLARFIYNVNLIDLNGQTQAYEKETILEFMSIRDLFSRTLDRPRKQMVQFKILELGCGHALPVLGICKYLG